MTRCSITCLRCHKPTIVDLDVSLSQQRCSECRGFIQGVDALPKKQGLVRHKKVKRNLGLGATISQWADQKTAVQPLRNRWPKFFKICIFLGIVATAAFATHLIYQQVKDMRKVPDTVVHGQEPPPPIDIRKSVNWRTKATAVARQAMAAREIPVILPLLTHAGVPEETITQFYSIEEPLPLGTDLEEDYIIVGDGSNLPAVAFPYIDPRGKPRNLVVVETKDGMKVDWAATAGRGQVSLKEYKLTRPEEPRVVLARASLVGYYNHDFSNDKKWVCARLADINDENPIFGYAERSSPVGAWLLTHCPDNSDGKNPMQMPLAVALRFPSTNFSSDQTEIVEMIDSTWYLPDGLEAAMARAAKLKHTPENQPGLLEQHEEKPDNSQLVPPSQ